MAVIMGSYDEVIPLSNPFTALAQNELVFPILIKLSSFSNSDEFREISSEAHCVSIPRAPTDKGSSHGICLR